MSPSDRPDGAVGLGEEVSGLFTVDDPGKGRDVVVFLDGKRAPPCTKAQTGEDGYVVGPALIPGTNKPDPTVQGPVVTVGHVRAFRRE